MLVPPLSIVGVRLDLKAVLLETHNTLLSFEVT